MISCRGEGLQTKPCKEKAHVDTKTQKKWNQNRDEERRVHKTISENKFKHHVNAFLLPFETPLVLPNMVVCVFFVCILVLAGLATAK